MVVRSGLRSAVRSAVYSGIADKFGGAFVLSSLWANGEEATLYEMDDLTALFLESTGSTNVSADAQTIGMQIDKAQMGKLSAADYIAAQPELITNGQFTSDISGWTDTSEAPGSISWGSGALILHNGNGSSSQEGIASQEFDTVISNGVYYLTMDRSGGSSNVVQIGNTAGAAGIYQSANGATAVDTHIVANLSSQFLTIRNFNTIADSRIDDVSIKGYSSLLATQSTTSAEPAWKTGGFIRYDGSDDCLLTSAVCGSSGNSLAVKVTLPASAASAQVIAGLQASTSTRFYLAVDTSGNLCAGVGNDGIATIIRSGNLFGETGVAVLTEDGSTVKLYWNGVEAYSDTQDGTPSTSVPFRRGALNNNGTAASFYSGDEHEWLHLDRALTAAEVANLTTSWS